MPRRLRSASLTLSKQESKVKAKAPTVGQEGRSRHRQGQGHQRVRQDRRPEATGKVIVKDGKKKVGKAKLKKGKFVVKVKGLAVGSHSLTVSYKGDGYTDKASSKKLKLTVTKLTPSST